MAFPVKKFARTAIAVLVVYALLSMLSHTFHGTKREKNGPSVRNQLLFVKTHKTGSSTIINLFQRYAYTHGLLVALPAKDDMFLGWPRLLENSPDVVLSLPNSSTKYDYVINHVVYKEHLLAPLFADSPVRVTLVRQPTEQLRSSFNYYDILREEDDKTTSVVKHMEQFFMNPRRFDASYTMDQWFVKSKTRNPQLADLGLSYDSMDSKSKIRAHVNVILNNFNLIMIADLMDESCVLLKRLMRWSLQDIIYKNKNMLQYPGKTDPISEDLKSSMLEWDWGDNLLYWKSKEMLLKLMGSEPRFQDELINFRQINSNVIGYCSQASMVEEQQLVVEATEWNEEFIVTAEFCSNVLRKERPFTRLLQVQHRPDIFNHSWYEAIEELPTLANTKP